MRLQLCINGFVLRCLFLRYLVWQICNWLGMLFQDIGLKYLQMLSLECSQHFNLVFECLVSTTIVNKLIWTFILPVL